MPSARALLVIMRAKRCSEPPSNSPSAVEASLAERVTSDRIACSTVIDCPARTPSFDGGSAEAFLEKGTGVDLLIRPASSASNAR
ncbi:hypothetical protein D3C86_2118940 [compost metagenome]